MNTDSQSSQPSEDEGETLLQLLEELDNIDENSEDAPLNKCSIENNNGGRIELMKRQTSKWPVVMLFRHLLLRKRAKPEQGDGA